MQREPDQRHVGDGDHQVAADHHAGGQHPVEQVDQRHPDRRLHVLPVDHLTRGRRHGRPLP
ncbi:hypothetical protein SF12_07610 [Streptomyces sp. MBRL 601]|nr:hypothetical protein SF12_07610 [Streptomyces sp. MBRL 601]